MNKYILPLAGMFLGYVQMVSLLHWQIGVGMLIISSVLFLATVISDLKGR